MLHECGRLDNKRIRLWAKYSLVSACEGLKCEAVVCRVPHGRSTLPCPLQTFPLSPSTGNTTRADEAFPTMRWPQREGSVACVLSWPHQLCSIWTDWFLFDRGCQVTACDGACAYQRALPPPPPLCLSPFRHLCGTAQTNGLSCLSFSSRVHSGSAPVQPFQQACAELTIALQKLLSAEQQRWHFSSQRETYFTSQSCCATSHLLASARH